MRLGGGLLIALAAGAAVAGFWLLAGVVVAALLAAAVQRLPEAGETKLDRVVVAFARLTELAAYGIAFGFYVFPSAPRFAAAGFVLAMVVLDLGGLRLPPFVTRWATALLVVAGLVLIALCVAVTPVSTTEGFGSPDVPGIVVAALVVLPFLRPGAQTYAGWRSLALGSAAVLVTFVALYQLGALRLGLSVTSLRDLLAAADADSLQPVLTVVAVLATVLPALAAVADLRERAGRRAAAGGILAAGFAWIAAPLVILVVAGLGTVTELLLRVRARRYSGARE